VNHSVESGVPQKSCFGGQGVTPRLNSEYAECRGLYITDSVVVKLGTAWV